MKKRFLSILLLLVMLVPAVAACTSGDGADTTAKKEPPSDTGTKVPNDLMAFVADGKTDFQIVYPHDCEESVRAQAQMLSAVIAEATGVEIPVVHALEKEAEHEIRIGKVSRPKEMDVWKAYDSFGERDYAVEVRGDDLYLFGKTAQSMIAALTYFKEKVLYLSTAVAGVKKDFSSTYISALADKGVTFTGMDADGYYAYLTIGSGVGETYLRVSFTDNKGWRLQTKRSASEDFNDIGASQRLALSLGEAPLLNVYPITASEEGGVITIRENGGTHVTVDTEDFEMNFYNANGDLSATVTELEANAGGAYVSGLIKPNEGIFGTGERFNAVNQRGKSISMFSKDEWSSPTACYMVIPLLCFSRGSGIFLNSYEYMSLKLGDDKKKAEQDEWSATISTATLDCYVYTTEHMSEAIKGYTDLSGHAEMPEEWTYGMILCRYSPDLSRKWTVEIKPDDSGDGRGIGVYDLIAYMEAYDLPWTTISAEPWSRYSTNATIRKDLKELCDYVHSLGKKLIVYMRVGLANSGMSNFQEKYLVEMVYPNGKTTTQLPVAETNNPDAAGGANAYPYVDITNPAACEWFFNEVWEDLSRDIGVDGCKIDFCETLPEYYELNYYDETMPTAGSHHWYPTAFCAKFWEMISQKPDSGMCYTRGGGIGSQRAPYMWAGDQTRSHSSLRMQLIATLSSGMSGVPFMSYDMAGYKYGSGLSAKEEAQIFIRGTQYTAFTICMQQHGNVLHAFEFATGKVKRVAVYQTPEGKYTNVKGSNKFIGWVDATTGGLDPETGKMREGDLVYVISPDTYSYATDIYRAYVKLHELLTPYITEYSEIACDTGMPVMRPLALMWQSDTATYDFTDEYMFGDAFLVAPVLTGAYQRNIYLPEGRWLDLNTGLEYEITADTPVEERWLNDYDVPLTVLPIFYNLSTTSTTAEELLPGIQEIFGYLAEIQSGIPD